MSRNHLKKRADGRYKVNYKNKQFYGKTKAEALKKRADYIASVMKGLDKNLSEVLFKDYGLHWVEVYRAQCKTPQLKQYAAIVEVTAECIGNKKMRDITATDLQQVANRMSVYSPSYMNKFLTTLRGIFRTAVADGATLRNPMEFVKRPRTKKCEGHRSLEEWERKLITENYEGHSFGLAAMVMMYAGLRRGEALYVDIDRDVDFEKKTLTVHGAIAFTDGNTPEASEGKTENAQRTIPLVTPLADALSGHHGLLCCKADGGILSQSAFDRKYSSWISYLETKLNGCYKRWYGRTKEHKAIIAAGGTLPEWKSVSIRCHDFRVDFCTRAYYAKVPLKTLQIWMGHADSSMILKIYTKLSKQEDDNGAELLEKYLASAC